MLRSDCLGGLLQAPLSPWDRLYWVRLLIDCSTAPRSNEKAKFRGFLNPLTSLWAGIVRPMYWPQTKQATARDPSSIDTSKPFTIPCRCILFFFLCCFYKERRYDSSGPVLPAGITSTEQLSRPLFPRSSSMTCRTVPGVPIFFAPE
jgi:hypothetical protein